MIVQCPRCGTRYRVNPAVATEPDPTFKCSRCRHLFSRRAEVRPESEASAAGEPDSTRDLPFASEEGRIDGEAEVQEPAGLDVAAPIEGMPVDRTEEEPTGPDPEARMDGPEDTEPPRLTTEAESQPGEPESSIQEGDESPADSGGGEVTLPEDQGAEPEEMLEQEMRAGVSQGWSLFAGVLIAVVVFPIALTSYVVTYPRATQTLLEAVPIVGNDLARDPLVPQLIHLEDLRYFRPPGRPLALILGKARNTTRHPVRGVDIEGTLYRGDGVAARKTVSCCKPLSRGVIESEELLTTLERVTPAPDFVIAPGRAEGFFLVFENPPSDLSEFGCRVVKADFDR